MTVDQAYEFFEDEIIKKGLRTMQKVGLGYIELGQSHDTFSGGEGQRRKLAKQLNKKGEIYILNEPTSGLHPYDVMNLLNLLNEIVNKGNTALTIEHNMNFIVESDWIIDLGPGGGDKGGEIVAAGTPKEVAKFDKSITGQYLNKFTS